MKDTLHYNEHINTKEGCIDCGATLCCEDLALQMTEDEITVSRNHPCRHEEILYLSH